MTISLTASNATVNGRVVPRLALLGLLAILAMGSAAACAGVRPWERGPLSDYIMRSDRDTLADSLYEHVYFTREAAAGGRSVGGGGCGCN